MINEAEPDSFQNYTIVCHDGVVAWDYDNCRWCWKTPPVGFEIKDPVPHEWDFNHIIESEN